MASSSHDVHPEVVVRQDGVLSADRCDDPLHSLLLEGVVGLGIVILDPDGRVVRSNRAATQLTGFAAEEIVGRHVSLLSSSEHAWSREAIRWLKEAALRPTVEFEEDCRHSDGSPWRAHLVVTALRDDGGELRGFACIMRDVTARTAGGLARSSELEAFRHLAVTDPLTGLRNRRDFDELLRTAPGQRFAILAIDLDGLKRVNDEFGHQAGDVLICSVAATLSMLVRGLDVLARFGGDEFAAVLLGAGPEEAAAIAERMRVAMHSIPSGEARISVGWASAPAGTDPRAVWSAADAAMYQAKRAGGDLVAGGAVPTPGVAPPGQPSIDERFEDLLAGRGLHAVYQPILRLSDGRLIGFEALARLTDDAPTDSVADLFGAAERARRISELDWRCRRMALADASALPAGALLFMNVSSAALVDPLHDVDQLILLMRWAGWPAEQTVLELNGRERIASRCRLATVLADYRRAGVRFALSNVATASRAARLLGALQPEFVKLDRTLTVTSRAESSANAIEGSIALARACGAMIIAEGLEDWDAIERMRALGIELGQGFSVGPPLRAGEVRDALEARIVAMRAGGCEDLPSDRHGSQLATLEERRSGVDPRTARRWTTHALLSWQARKNVEAVLTRLVRTRSAIEESRAAMRPRQVASDPERPREQ